MIVKINGVKIPVSNQIIKKNFLFIISLNMSLHEENYEHFTYFVYII